MKYGEQFESESVPQWSLYNIDYNALKHHIKVHTTKDQASAIAIPGQPDTALTKFEDELYSELCRQHDRVDLFVKSKADELTRRLQHLSNQIHRQIVRSVTSRRNSMSFKRQRRFARYETQLLQCGEEIQDLDRFVNAQIVAFRKILKKYKKWTGSSTLGTRFRDNVLSDPKSFTRRDNSQLQTCYEDLLETVRATSSTDGSNIASPRPVAETDHHLLPRDQLSPSETIVVASNSPPRMGYWNEYDYGSEAGDLEQNGDACYAIYVDPNEHSGFPGFDALRILLKSPVSKWKAWTNSTRSSDTADSERSALLSRQSNAYGSMDRSYFSSVPGEPLRSADSDADDDDHDRHSPFDRTSSSHGYASSTEGFPIGYKSHYAALPSIRDQRMVQYRDRVFFWGTWAGYAGSFALMGIAMILITTGKHKRRTIQAGWNFQPDSPSLSNLTKELLAARAALDLSEFPLTPLPIGVGFIICHPSFFDSFEKGILPILQEHSPQAVWLFAPDPAFVTEGKVRGVIERLHDSGFMVLYQVGTVAAARQAVRDGADIIVAQGVDAGGHQFASGAGIFLVAKEALTPEFRRKILLETSDGGATTVKSTFHDDIQGTTIWHPIYDGRAIRGSSYEDHAKGMSLEENLKLFNEAKEKGDNSRAVMWSGTGVGLLKREQPAGEIVREVREVAKQRIHFLQQTFL
ncbi:hypothetical protein V8F20_005772 [Naviculisporaceae sp. PSN 640]